MSDRILDVFSAPTRSWFQASFDAPTEAQEGAWGAMHGGAEAVLVVAPTGSGKTLAAFLWSIDVLCNRKLPPLRERLRVLYVSPLKALAADVERNLRVPLDGIRDVAARMQHPLADVTVGLRSGDTPAAQRRRLGTHPPDILITTPESLFLMLTSAARETLKTVDTVIIDEVHAVLATKRGAHLALSLARLDALAGGGRARRIGLSATVQPIDEAARFLAGYDDAGAPRAVTVVAPTSRRTFDVRVELAVNDAAAPPGENGRQPLIWPAIEARLVALIGQHRSTIVFANSRRLAERLCARLNEVAEREIARAHHGSVSPQQRHEIEEALKSGQLPAVVATSSLELGIDMAAVDLVVQVEAPPTVASGLQRVGRAGHQVGAQSHGVFFPKWRGDLLECAVVAEGMRQGQIEPQRCPRNPLDVLAQHVVAMVAMETLDVDALARLVRRTASFHELPQSALDGVLDMLSGFYPSDEFAQLRPRLNYNRIDGRLSARQGAQRLAVTNAGTIPDRGLFGVYLAGEGKSGKRVGELDEEMVYESRRGEVFVLGSSSWRIEDITHDRVWVSPAPGEAGKLPFWKGDTLGRPIELGRACGRFLRELTSAAPDAALRRLAAVGLDELAAQDLLAYLNEQIAATGSVADDRTIVLERFQDPLGDWRLCIHSPFGARVHAPWSLAIAARVRERMDVEVQNIYTDDGIVIRLTEADTTPPIDYVLFDVEDVESIVTAEVGHSALFASRFRECAARALLLPRRRPDVRTPLWQQRQRSANLLSVAAGYGSFPIVLEAMRECLQDVFDLEALRGLMADIRARAVRVVQVQTERPSPFASALLFGYIGAFIYDGDAPLAERRAQALSLDTTLLAELLGQAELRDVIDADALAEIEARLQRRLPEQAIRGVDDAHDALRVLGDLTREALYARGAAPPWVDALLGEKRAVETLINGEPRCFAAEDAARYRDALGVVLPQGLPAVFLVSPHDAISDLVGRWARTHGPFQPGDVATRYGLDVTVVAHALARLERNGRVVRGEFRPGGHGLEWCDVEVLRSLRRRSLARLRKEVEAVDAIAYARFLPLWQGVGTERRARDQVLRVVEQLEGVPLPASALETLVLPVRVEGYGPWMLDEICASGDVVWMGRGAIGNDDGWICLYLADDFGSLRPPDGGAALSELARQILEILQGSGAMFYRQIVERVSIETRRPPPPDSAMLDALWDLVWAGRLTNDTLAPVRARVGGGARTDARRAARRMRRGPSLPSRLGPPAAAGRWSAFAPDLVTPRAEGPGARDAATRRATALAEQLLERHGVVTRGAVVAEEIAGGFSAVYDVLAAFEESGRCRRGYFIEGLGAAQFAAHGAVDRLRAVAAARAAEPSAWVLAATDPANAYGAALPWPAAPDDSHRAGRKAGALVVLLDGALTLYVERGGRTLLSFVDSERALQIAARALADVVRRGLLGRISVERVNGQPIFGTAVCAAMLAAGFRETHRGLVMSVLREGSS